MAKTIFVATNLTSVTPPEGASRQVPDVGVAELNLEMVETAPDYFMGSAYSGTYPGNITLRAVNTIRIGPTQYTLYGGQVEGQEMFDAIEFALGSTRVKDGKSALTSPFRGRIEQSVRAVRRKSDGVTVGFQAATAVAGEDPLISSLDDADDPGEFEAVDPA